MYFSFVNVFKSLYFYVLLAMILGIVAGFVAPQWAIGLKPLGDLFIKLVKLLIGPIIFLTVSLGIASVRDFKLLGRTALKAFIYFELITTLALLLGMGVAELVQPGAGIQPRLTEAQQQETASMINKLNARANGTLQIAPDNFLKAFMEGNTLQILLLAILFGLCLAKLKERSQPMQQGFDQLGGWLFSALKGLMYLSPLGAFGAMAYTVGSQGLGVLLSLGQLLLCVYLTCLIFVALVLGSVCYYYKINLIKLLRYLRDEIGIVLGTSSSETVLTRLMEKLERAGCSRSIVRLVVPSGYSFNLDGTAIYLTLAALFIAQAFHNPLSWGDKFTLLGVFMLTSKGAAGVTGAGLLTLMATLSAVGTIPLFEAGIILGLDRFLSEARAITNLIGNAVATLVISASEDQLDREKMHEVMK